MKKKLLISAGVIVVLAIGLFAYFNPRRKTGTEVYTAKVESGAITSVVSANGEIQPRTRVNISSQVPGEIVAMPIKEGDVVRKGQVLVRIDQERYIQEARSLEATLRMTRVAVEQEQTRHKTLESQFRRAEALRGQGILPEESYEQTLLAYDSSTIQLRSLEESVSQAQAALDKARDQLAKTIIYAPIDGKVTQLDTEVGEQVIVGTTNIPGSVMMVIADMSEVLAEVDVDETEVVKVRFGQPSTVTVDAVEGNKYHGSVTEIRNSARKKQDVNVFGVKLLLADPDERLRPGMSARAKIEIEKRNGVIRIPVQAVVEKTGKQLEEEIAKAGSAKPGRGDRTSGSSASAEKTSAGAQSSGPSSGAVASPGGAAPSSEAKTSAAIEEGKSSEKKAEDEKFDVVYVLRDGKAEAVKVKTGLADETHAEILSGLKEGDVVITGPYRSLRKLKHGEKIIEKKETEFIGAQTDSGKEEK